MVACPFAIHNLCEKQLLQSVAVSKHTALSEAGSEGGDVVPASHCHLVQGLPVSTLHMLDHHVAVDKVGAYPGRVEAGSAAIQENHAHYIIPNVPLLVHL